MPTNLGIIIIHGLSKIDPDLATPKLRSEMEQKISQIARGEQDWQVVLEESIQTYLTKFQNFTSKIGNMDVLFESTFSPLSSSGKSFSKCGRCRRYMFLINLRPVRLHCRNCNETYPLPSSVERSNSIRNSFVLWIVSNWCYGALDLTARVWQSVLSATTTLLLLEYLREWVVMTV